MCQILKGHRVAANLHLLTGLRPFTNVGVRQRTLNLAKTCFVGLSWSLHNSCGIDFVNPH